MTRARLGLALAALLGAAGCAGGPNLDQLALAAPDPAEKTGGEPAPGGDLPPGAELRLAGGPVMRVVSGGFRLDGACLVGEGRLRLPDRAGVSDSWNLDFHFAWEAWARLRLIAQAGPDGRDAFVLDLSRAAAGVQVTAEAQGATENWSDVAALQTLLARDEVRFNLDLHHDDAHRQYAHLLFFEGERLVMDSGRDTLGTPGKGSGRAQFLDLQGVRLCGLRLAPPKNGG